VFFWRFFCGQIVLKVWISLLGLFQAMEIKIEVMSKDSAWKKSNFLLFVLYFPSSSLCHRRTPGALKTTVLSIPDKTIKFL